ncbi:MAG: MarR family transcriptional regulator [Actinomycetota bacterium]|nr:MarR family transcriptional regulator [Actinomycetota bacterium]
MSDTMTARWLDSDQQAHWRAFLSGTTRLFERLDRQLRERSGISLAEYEILVRLSEAPGQHLRMAELASSLAHSRSRITHTVARLEAAGAVIRRACPSDGRGVLALLTDDGMRMLVDAAPGHVDAVRDYLVDVASPADFEAVGRVFGATADLLADDS